MADVSTWEKVAATSTAVGGVVRCWAQVLPGLLHDR